ncbi:alpha/beta hydrolase [Intrasporangium sp.]|uniref:alpha/beta fold hydrolase n=1 Tax=Intrasporangium sp. TaxID=1925024 RepID=UPI003221FA87
MQVAGGVQRRIIDITVGDVDVALDTLVRAGQEPIVFLHGFGSTKEEYVDLVRFPALHDRAFVAYDAPGFGRSTATDLTAVSIPFLVDVALTVLDRLGIERFHLVGHSMGGLTALILADRCPERVLSFTDIEGNVAPEDCFLSRQIISHGGDSGPEEFLAAFAGRVYAADESASAMYASNVEARVDPRVVRSVFESMVDLSDNGDLLARFIALPFPRIFMYGEQNAALTYLPALTAAGVELAEIPFSGHWPMYSNPVEMWRRLAALVNRAGRGGR